MLCALITFLQYFKGATEGGTNDPPCLRFLKYCQNFICAQNMLIYFRLHCLLYIYLLGGVDASQANLLKKALHGVNVIKEHPFSLHVQYSLNL